MQTVLVPAEHEVDAFADVAIDVPVYSTFTYAVPTSAQKTLEAGMRVLVSFRGRSRNGVVLRRRGPPDASIRDKVLTIGDVLDDAPLLSPAMIELLEWTARYYHAPVGETVRMAIPAALRNPGRRLVAITDPGRKTLDAGVVTDEVVLRMLEELAAAEAPVQAPALKKRIRGLTFASMARCEKAGWLVSSFRATRGKGIKRTTFVRLLRDPFKDERLGTRQAEIIIALQTRELRTWVSVDVLRDHVDAPLATLRTLATRGLLELESRESYRDPFADEPAEKPTAHELTTDQASAVGEIRALLTERKFGTFLLHGVTGSGKTEVYMRLIREVVERGDRALVLLPEISLTPQFVSVFRAHFGRSIAVLHSGLSDGERYDEWRRINRGEVSIVIGARSALFAPIRKLGIIIVDEEHDGSFKQENSPRYSARDMAQVRGRLENAVVVLGSATPSVETYQNAREGKIGYLPMATRVGERAMPDVEIVDLRVQSERLEIDGVPDAKVLSTRLADAVQRTLDAGQQTILFLNRRGHSPYVQCRACGKAWECPSCSVTLTYHRGPHRLFCHYCDFHQAMPERCDTCGEGIVGLLGMGTQKLETLLGNLFPTARTARLDRDTSKNLRQVIRKFRRREIDILIGTQMVAKGHDFPHVTLVGVVLADISLRFPDLRAGEYTFQLLTQVAGRAGRGEKAGRVIIQTYAPWHYALVAAQTHSYSDFVTHELSMRREMGYPPFGALVSILFESRNESAARREAQRYGACGRHLMSQDAELAERVTMLGPAQAPLARLRGKSRFHLVLKGRTRGVLRTALGRLLDSAGFHARKGDPAVAIHVDVDPRSMS